MRLPRQIRRAVRVLSRPAAYEAATTDVSRYESTRMLNTAMSYLMNEKLVGDYVEFGVYRGATFVEAFHAAELAALTRCGSLPATRSRVSLRRAGRSRRRVRGQPRNVRGDAPGEQSPAVAGPNRGGVLLGRATRGIAQRDRTGLDRLRPVRIHCSRPQLPHRRLIDGAVVASTTGTPTGATRIRVSSLPLGSGSSETHSSGCIPIGPFVVGPIVLLRQTIRAATQTT